MSAFRLSFTILSLFVSVIPKMSEAAWVDTGKNAVLFKFNDEMLDFGIDHVQTLMTADYGDLINVSSSNPLSFNQIIYANSEYMDLFALDGSKNAYTSPLYFACPEFKTTDVIGVWQVASDGSGKRETSDPDYNPMACRYILKLTDKKKTENADGTKTKKDRNVYFELAIEDLKWDFDVSDLTFKLVNSSSQVSSMISTAASKGSYDADNLCPFDGTTLEENCNSAISGFFSYDSAFEAYDTSKHQFAKLTGAVQFGASANIVLRISCDKNEGTGCPEWFSDFASTITDGTASETSDEKIFEVKSAVSIDKLRPEVWSQWAVESQEFSLVALFLKGFTIQGLSYSTTDLVDYVLDAADVVVNNSRIWGIGFFVRWLFKAAIDVADFLSGFITNFADQHIDVFYPFVGQMANKALASSAHDTFIMTLNAMQTAPIVGTASIGVEKIKSHQTGSGASNASTNAISATISAAPETLLCLGGTRPELAVPSGKYDSTATYHVGLGLAKQTVQVIADATVESVDWCQEVDFDSGIPCVGSMCPPSMGSPSTIQLTQNLSTILYPTFAWYESGINRAAAGATLGSGATAISPASLGSAMSGAIRSLLSDEDEIATLSFQGIDDASAVQGHVVFKTSTGIPLYEADYTGNVTAYLELSQDCSGDYWLEADRFVWDDELAFTNTVALDPGMQAYLESMATALLAQTKVAIEAFVTSNARLKMPTDYTDTEARVCATIGTVGLNGDYGLFPITLSEECPEVEDESCTGGESEDEPETPIDTPTTPVTPDIPTVTPGDDISTTMPSTSGSSSTGTSGGTSIGTGSGGTNGISFPVSR